MAYQVSAECVSSRDCFDIWKYTYSDDVISFVLTLKDTSTNNTCEGIAHLMKMAKPYSNRRLNFTVSSDGSSYAATLTLMLCNRVFAIIDTSEKDTSTRVTYHTKLVESGGSEQDLLVQFARSLNGIYPLGIYALVDNNYETEYCLMGEELIDLIATL